MAQVSLAACMAGTRAARSTPFKPWCCQPVPLGKLADHLQTHVRHSQSEPQRASEGGADDGQQRGSEVKAAPRGGGMRAQPPPGTSHRPGVLWPWWAGEMGNGRRLKNGSW